MFSQVSVHKGDGGYLWSHVLSGGAWLYLVSGPYWGWVGMSPCVSMSRGWEIDPPTWELKELGTQPLRHGTLKECSGWGRTWDTMGYDWQAGSTHPTGMLSCFWTLWLCDGLTRDGAVVYTLHLVELLKKNLSRALPLIYRWVAL